MLFRSTTPAAAWNAVPVLSIINSAGKYAGRTHAGRTAADFQQYAPIASDAPLTDTTARPAPNENHLLINAYSTHPQSPLLAVTRRIADSGCNLVDTRLSTVGRDVSVTALATGSWDAVAKLETMMAKLEREEGLKLVWYRTGPKPVQSSLLPYVVEVIASDKPGILFQLADFFDRQGITIESLHLSRHREAHLFEHVAARPPGGHVLQGSHEAPGEGRMAVLARVEHRLVAAG